MLLHRNLENITLQNHSFPALLISKIDNLDINLFSKRETQGRLRTSWLLISLFRVTPPGGSSESSLHLIPWFLFGQYQIKAPITQVAIEQAACSQSSRFSGAQGVLQLQSHWDTWALISLSTSEPADVSEATGITVPWTGTRPPCLGQKSANAPA